MKFVGTVQGMGRWAAPKKVYKNLGSSSFSRPPIILAEEELPQDLKKKKEGGGGFQVEFIRVGESRR